MGENDMSPRIEALHSREMFANMVRRAIGHEHSRLRESYVDDVWEDYVVNDHDVDDVICSELELAPSDFPSTEAFVEERMPVILNGFIKRIEGLRATVIEDAYTRLSEVVIADLRRLYAELGVAEAFEPTELLQGVVPRRFAGRLASAVPVRPAGAATLDEAAFHFPELERTLAELLATFPKDGDPDELAQKVYDEAYFFLQDLFAEIDEALEEDMKGGSGRRPLVIETLLTRAERERQKLLSLIGIGGKPAEGVGAGPVARCGRRWEQ